MGPLGGVLRRCPTRAHFLLLDKRGLVVTHEPLGVAVFAVGVLLAYNYQFSAVRTAGSLDSPSLVLGEDGQTRDYGGGAPEVLPGMAETLREEVISEGDPEGDLT